MAFLWHHLLVAIFWSSSLQFYPGSSWCLLHRMSNQQLTGYCSTVTFHHSLKCSWPLGCKENHFSGLSFGQSQTINCYLPVTYLLHAMWHIRPQHNPANQLYQPLRFVPHSSSSIQLFPFLSLLSSSMLSLVYPVFAALLGSRLMQFCSHYLVLSSWCDRWKQWPSKPKIILTSPKTFHLFCTKC